MTIENIDKMIELSKAKKDYVRAILNLTREQKEIIENEDMDKLNEIISHKEKLMKKIDLLDLNFLSLYNETREMENVDAISKINPVKYENIGDLQKIVDDINNILKDISDLDKKNTEAMKKNLEEIKSGLKQVKEVKKAYKGYNYEISGSILIDEKK